jgi:CAAX prenyl protease-like protein
MGLEWALPGTSASSTLPTSLAVIPAGLAAVWLLVRVLGSAITVPIAEELAFRGYLLRRLVSANFDEPSTLRFTWLSFVVSPLLFGALHGRWLAGTVAGMCYA